MIALSPRGLLLLLLLVGFLYAAPRFAAPAQEPIAAADPTVQSDKRIAFSFDDTPRGAGAFLEKDERHELLIEALETAGIEQAAFFINPGRITPSDHDAEIVMAYAKAGHVLANHTAHHSKLASTSVEKFLADVDEAAEWLEGKPNFRPWFRFPHLDEGSKDKAKRNAVRKALKQRGLMNGYVTIDASDWYMEDLALAASKSGKLIDWNALRDLFVESYVQSANFSDDLARRTLGRAPVQMILLHETDLAAMFVDDLAEALKKDGWIIVSADEAYRDPIAFMEPDVEFADGTRTQMLAAERKVSNRWYERNDQKVAKKLFAERVLHE
ncbi:polysaccharide deacetylase family protein [Parasphingorhabdus halotolerans]|uniref:Chitooligosaccharide deacetylase n=1 Tax=Parasphingorhabdus halotolerans TaxID=2725558 RepID=A0A6H2DKT6_9SPHN|nr:polysaccharide deacetylase family protein [Parasphingorhabdus halotolerans]QJB69000.1 polysaccharide deacetylase family protein [Parasphingorhabdus halotolerans]